MTWKKAREEHDSETVLVCTATYFPDIEPSIRELVERMETDWVAAGHAKEEAVFVEISATNGHMMFSWDKKGGGGCFYDENWPTYYLELKELWHESLEHEEGARHFDNQAHIALSCVVEELLVEAEDADEEERYEFYELFEGSTGGAQRVLV